VLARRKNLIQRDAFKLARRQIGLALQAQLFLQLPQDYLIASNTSLIQPKFLILDQKLLN